MKEKNKKESIMKRLIQTSIFALAVVTIACGSQPADKPESNTSSNSDTKVESTETKGTEKLTLEKFKTHVWDFEASPEEFVFKGDKPVLIDFYADWCGPCKMTAPILEELAEEYHGQIVIYKVNVDHERELAQGFGIRSIPSFLYIPTEGQPSFGQPGANSKEGFKRDIETKLLGKSL